MTSDERRLPLSSWAENDRPREKLLGRGRQALTEAELIAILIGSGSASETAVELSRRILSSSGNRLDELAKLTVKDLQKFKGIGEAKALSIIAALELGRRRMETGAPDRVKFITSADVYGRMRAFYIDLPHEEFHMLLLNRARELITRVFVSKGGVSSTIVDPKIIFKQALEHMASYIILCHNHPSGNPQPSEHDIKLTKNLREAGMLLDLPVLDHIIITDTSYFSFANAGMLHYPAVFKQG